MSVGKRLNYRIAFWVFLPLAATSIAVVAVSALSRFHNHLALVITLLLSGFLSTALSAWRLNRLIIDRQLLNEQKFSFLQTLIDTIPSPIYYKDTSGSYLGCNRAFESATGAVRNEIVGKTAHGFFVQELADIYCRGDDELLARGGELVFGSVAPYADGTLRHVIFHKTTFADLHGSVGGLVGIYMDVSEQQKAQEALAQEKNFTASMLKGSATPTFVIDKNHQVIFWNRACEVLTGIHAADILASDCHWRGFYPEKRPCLADYLIDRTIPDAARGVSRSSIIPDGLQSEGWLNVCGRQRYLFYNAAPIYNDKGDLVAAIETLEDITARKQLEEELVKLTYAVTQCPTGIIITDNRGDIEYVNPRFTEITGYTLADVQGKYSSLFRWVDAPETLYRELLATIRAGNEWRGRFYSRKKNGEPYWEDALVGPIKNSAGEISHFIAIKEDISERMHLEEQLQYSQKMESIGRMAGGLAHDFNNILTAISGYVGIMEFYTADDSALTPSIRQIRNAVERAAGLVSSLLDFSRRQQTNPLPVNLNDIVSRVGKLVSTLVGEDITLHNSLSETPLEILADSVQIEQLIMHLASNARDAMQHGGELWVGTRLTKLDQDFVRRYGFGVVGDYALLTVTDNGAGMDAETREKIYEPFFTTKGVGKGSGLGLSVVYGCVKQHRGFLTCYSEPGKGTQFNIYLPLYQESAENEHEETPLATKPTDNNQLRGTETLLLVEDDGEVLTIIRSLLEEFGYTVLIARNGDQGLSLFRQQPNKINLVVLDAIMPHKSGWDTFKKMQATVPLLKTVFISGYSREALIEKGMLETDSNFLSKPIAPIDLLKTVREVLDK